MRHQVQSTIEAQQKTEKMAQREGDLLKTSSAHASFCTVIAIHEMILYGAGAGLSGLGFIAWQRIIRTARAAIIQAAAVAGCVSDGQVLVLSTIKCCVVLVSNYGRESRHHYHHHHHYHSHRLLHRSCPPLHRSLHRPCRYPVSLYPVVLLH